MRDDEQSVMKSGRVFQARGPATANARSPSVVRHVTGTSRADEDDDRSLNKVSGVGPDIKRAVQFGIINILSLYS